MDMHHSLFLLSLIQFRLLAVMNTNIDYSSDRFKLSNLENLQILKVRFLFVVVCFSSVLTVHPLGTRPESFEDVQSETDVQSEISQLKVNRLVNLLYLADAKLGKKYSC